MGRKGLWIVPVLAFLAACNSNNIVQDNDAGRYFDSAGVTGSFGLFDNPQGLFSIYQLPAFKDSAYTPAASFDIVQSLIAIQTGSASNENMVINWDKQIRFLPNGDTAKEWNRDLNMQAAFTGGVHPWFQELARKTGKDTMQHWLDSLGYGQRYGKFSIRNNLDSFWLDNTLKVTADEQLGLVKKLYFDQLPVFKSTAAIVRKMMLREDNANYKLSYKTARATIPGNHTLLWVSGWIEENKHAYFFVLQALAPEKQSFPETKAVELLKKILAAKGFFQGKK
jgi:beta-lactamase class D